MRKLIVVSMLIVSFALGMVSQKLVFAGIASMFDFEVPSLGDPAPNLVNGIIHDQGWAVYKTPSGWKFIDASLNATKTSVVVKYLRRKQQ